MDSSYDAYTTTSAELSGGDIILFLITWLMGLAIAICSVIGLWKIFTKAGKPGWAAIVPVYNMIVLLEIVGRPAWWVLFAFAPFVNIFFLVMVTMDLAKSFGKSSGFGVLMAFFAPIMYLVLGFSEDRYLGPAAAQGAYYPGGGYAQQPQYYGPAPNYGAQPPYNGQPQQPQQFQQPQPPQQYQQTQQPQQPQPPVSNDNQ